MFCEHIMDANKHKFFSKATFNIIAVGKKAGVKTADSNSCGLKGLRPDLGGYDTDNKATGK